MSDNDLNSIEQESYVEYEYYDAEKTRIKSATPLKKVLAPHEGVHIHGTVLEYDEKGHLSRETPYVNDQREGLEVQYHANGTIAFTRPYTKDLINGVVTAWHPNGQLKRKIPHINNQVNGIVESYDTDGKLESTCQFRDNIKYGPERKFSSSGNLVSEVLNFQDVTEKNEYLMDLYKENMTNPDPVTEQLIKDMSFSRKTVSIG